MVTETKPRSQAEAFNVEETLDNLAENNKRSLQAAMTFTRNSLSAGYQITKDVQDEQVRFADTVLTQIIASHKNYIKSIQTYAQEFYRFSDQVIRDNQEMVEEAVEKTLDLVKPAIRKQR